MSKADNTSMRLIVMDRRRQVAALRLRGYTTREIQKGLANPGKDQPPLLNPKTQLPWSLKAIHTDIVALEKAWREDMVDRVDEHKSRLFAELQEIARACWKEKDYERVLKSIAQQRELLGTDAPKMTKAELTGPGGKPIVVVVTANDAGVL
jgi:DNA-binding transcriptional MerR regulator